MIQALARFLQTEDGAVTVDWVVLTAAVVGMSMVVMAFMRQPVGSMAGYIADEVMDANSFFTP